jgi:DNA primase
VRTNISHMSLPPGFLDELRTRTSLSTVVGRKVMWDNRKSNQGKGDMWAPCPFHQEKSASFHVDDRQGFYYCFGCQAKGDAISFVRETENVGFMEAIEILAGEAGLQMPARDPQAREKADRRTELANVMEVAVKWLRLQLGTAAAGDARAYLARRGLLPATQDRFEIGFAPDSRQAMWQALTAKGLDPEHIIAAGLAAKPDDGGAPYDRFRGRIIYPIRDGRGRCVGLGGRAMAADARAKYLNSPETELFDKGRNLYNQAPAREAAGKGAPLIVTEGYMDVIALVEAGFGATVAPLGTAITEEQLRLLWRISPEPVIALDGDKAGLRAALRLIDLALPLLEPGKSLRFCLLPEGKDPDDLVRGPGGQKAMQALVERSEPMVALLWRRETEGLVLDSPERRAGLDKTLREALRKIADPSIRGHYADEIRRLRATLFGVSPVGNDRPWEPGVAQNGGARGRPNRGWSNGWKGRGWTPPATAQASTKASLLAASDGPMASEALREAVILATLLVHPKLLDEFAALLEETRFDGPGHTHIAQALLAARATDPDALRKEIDDAIGIEPLEILLSPRHVQLSPTLRRPNDTDLARMCLTEEMAKLVSSRGAAREVADAMTEMLGEATEGTDWRLVQAAKARHRASSSTDNDSADFDIAPNGARLDREERSALDKLLAAIERTSPDKTGR